MATSMNHWSQGLLDDLSQPDKWFLSNENVVVITDKYPKAKFHLLVLPRQNISSIFYLSKDHLDLLTEMYAMALRAIKAKGRNQNEFKIGYHAEPSMQQLHLHVISTDFDSSTLRTQRHWNSFNTELFIPHHELMQRIHIDGKISKLDSDVVRELRQTPLKCHRCGKKPRNIRALKSHLGEHAKNA